MDYIIVIIRVTLFSKFITLGHILSLGSKYAMMMGLIITLPLLIPLIIFGTNISGHQQNMSYIILVLLSLFAMVLSSFFGGEALKNTTE